MKKIKSALKGALSETHETLLEKQDDTMKIVQETLLPDKDFSSAEKAQATLQGMIERGEDLMQEEEVTDVAEEGIVNFATHFFFGVKKEKVPSAAAIVGKVDAHQFLATITQERFATLLSNAKAENEGTEQYRRSASVVADALFKAVKGEDTDRPSASPKAAEAAPSRTRICTIDDLANIV